MPRRPPRYCQVFGKDASRKWFAANQDYRTYVEESKQTGVLHRELMIPAKLIPMLIRQVLGGKFASGKTLDNDQLLRDIKGHVGYIINGNEPPR